MTFRDRDDAGRQLARALTRLRGQDVVVLGLPRGGVPVAARVAEALMAPLDVIVVRKLGVPHEPELAMGAIGEGGVRVANQEVLKSWRLTEKDLDRAERKEREVLQRRVHRLREGQPAAPLAGRTAVVVDDGIATGATARAACLVARAHGASRVVLAAPVASPRAVADLQAVADEVVCLESPSWFSTVGQAYRDFAPVEDADVVALLDASRRTSLPPSSASRPYEVEVGAGRVRLAGTLVPPNGTDAVVLFAHGGGSSRHSPRNRYVADELNRAGLGTLLIDLLPSSEGEDPALAFDVELLAERLLLATQWMRRRSGLDRAAVGYFGASTGAAVALWAAASPRSHVGAVVSRGGRPDLAAPRLHLVTAPTLLIVGGHDKVVLELNRRAQAMMQTEVELTVVPGAGHLFAEPGALDAVAEASRDWFVRHLVNADFAAAVPDATVRAASERLKRRHAGR